MTTATKTRTATINFIYANMHDVLTTTSPSVERTVEDHSREDHCPRTADLVKEDMLQELYEAQGNNLEATKLFDEFYSLSVGDIIKVEIKDQYASGNAHTAHFAVTSFGFREIFEAQLMKWELLDSRERSFYIRELDNRKTWNVDA